MCVSILALSFSESGTNSFRGYIFEIGYFSWTWLLGRDRKGFWGSFIV